MSEEKPGKPAPGLSIGTFTQESGAQAAIQGDFVTDGAVKSEGDGNTITTTVNKGADPWADVDAALEEIDVAHRSEAAELVADLKAVSTVENTDPGVIQDIVDKLKPYQPLARPLLAALRVMPIAGIAVPIIEAAWELAKS